MVIFLKNVANMVTLALRTPWMLQLTSKFLFFFSLALLKTVLAPLDSLQGAIFEFLFGMAPSEEPQEAKASALPSGAKIF